MSKQDHKSTGRFKHVRPEQYLLQVTQRIYIEPYVQLIQTAEQLAHNGSQVFHVQTSLNNVPIHTVKISPSPVLCKDQAPIEDDQREGQCAKFRNQDLTFLPKHTSNLMQTSHQIKLPTRKHQHQLIHTDKPVLGFTPEEFKEKQEDPNITIEDLLQIEACKDYVKTLIQTLDSRYINQPKRFLPLVKEAKKIAETLRKEQQVAQWTGIPPEKIVLDCFIEQLNVVQVLEQLALLHAVKEHLPQDIIEILELLGKADSIPFNQLFNLAEKCTDKYYTNIINY